MEQNMTEIPRCDFLLVKKTTEMNWNSVSPLTWWNKVRTRQGVWLNLEGTEVKRGYKWEKKKAVVFWMPQLVKALHKCPARWTVSPLPSDLGLQMIHGIHWSSTPACQSVIRASQFLFFAFHPCFYLIQLISQWCIGKCERSSSEMQKSFLSVHGSSATLPLYSVFSLVFASCSSGTFKIDLIFSNNFTNTDSTKGHPPGQKSSVLFALRGHLPLNIIFTIYFKIAVYPF